MSTTGQTTPHQDPATTRALVTVETSERLVNQALAMLSEVPEGDLQAAPLTVAGAIEDIRALLSEIADLTSTTTCSMVKDQALSDDISRQARATVTDALARVEKALAPK